MQGGENQQPSLIPASLSSTAVAEEEKIPAPPPQTLLASAYRNRETFMLNPVAEIKPDKLIELDGYAFDIDELADYAKQDLITIFRNPHFAPKIKEFSTEARRKMKEHSVLQEYISALENSLASQTAYIRPQTVHAVIIMLNNLDKDGVAGSVEARISFLAHKHSLSDMEQKKLDEFIIEVPSTHGGSGGFQRMSFAAAFSGGFNECILTTQEFCWQFVVTMRPSAIVLVPQAVRQIAGLHHLAIKPPAQAPQKNELELNAADASAIESMLALEEAAPRLANPESEEQYAEEESDNPDSGEFSILGMMGELTANLTILSHIATLSGLIPDFTDEGVRYTRDPSATLTYPQIALDELEYFERRSLNTIAPPNPFITIITFAWTSQLREAIQQQTQRSTTSILQDLLGRERHLAIDEPIVISSSRPSPAIRASRIDFELEFARFVQTLTEPNSEEAPASDNEHPGPMP